MAKEEHKPDFLYIVRVAGKDLDGERNVILALADLKGIGNRLAASILKQLDIPSDVLIGDLGEERIEKLKSFIENGDYGSFPPWMLNHRIDIASGKNLNLVQNDLDIRILEDVNRLKKIRSYKGIRHETGHKVRGQRTRSNGRKGLAIGVIKKKEGQAPPAKEE
ncbi:MAG: 30S ribosomal protein S13 [Candidatus Thermoplasmatota archaeon]|jgi:small subunit ribosomal protein S13|nr:30S ribosomal protein S13 [Candidatus Thermoplasmatota archaeon]MCL5785747.1 30S ribosomal protein S13 [Candidatus Thermoplasmatota archaeon]